MNDQMQWVANKMPKTGAEKELSMMNYEAVSMVRAFHKSFPQYSETPLAALNNLAAAKGVGGIYIKDESYRFGLNAFKVLGSSYAIACFIAQQLGSHISQLDYSRLISPELKQQLGEFTFFTATDGNHGRGVAWAANKLGQKSVVYMPKGSSQIRLDAIRAEGAQAQVTEFGYMDTIKLAYAESQKIANGVVVQDTAWPGYEEIPTWIMQGYGTMAQEASEQLRACGVNRPTHIIVQAGVGSAAGAILGYFANMYPENCPVVIVVEAPSYSCLYQSALKCDGSTVVAKGDEPTIMAGLACEEANTISWEILREKAGFFVSLPDWAAARAMRVMGVPLKGDPKVISGESGAAGMGVLLELLDNPHFQDFAQAAGIDKSSHILMFSTEGNTDPDRYRSVVWDGEYPRNHSN